MKLILTCEHAGNEIPDHYQQYFGGAGDVLGTHRGYDPGALDLFDSLKQLAFFSQPYMISRLLVEPNRSLEHSQLFSEFTGNLPTDVKKEILADFYFPYRNYIETKIKGLIEAGEKVLHISVHSFTPQLDGVVRDADVGLLFDPAREDEKSFCEEYKRKLNLKEEMLRVKYNYPYLGTADGFTTSLREKFPENYLGIELEVNQKFSYNNKMEEKLKDSLQQTLKEILQ